MKTPEQIANQILGVVDIYEGSISEETPEGEPLIGSVERLREILIDAIERDRAQRNADLIEDLRQIRAEKGDWRGVLDSLIGD